MIVVGMGMNLAIGDPESTSCPPLHPGPPYLWRAKRKSLGFLRDRESKLSQLLSPSYLSLVLLSCLNPYAAVVTISSRVRTFSFFPHKSGFDMSRAGDKFQASAGHK